MPGSAPSDENHSPNKARCSLTRFYRFIEPLILFHLSRHATAYGYELHEVLNDHALTESEIDRGAVYRTLRVLEANGRVTSTWNLSSAGPARRQYQISVAGREQLGDWVRVMKKMHRNIGAFVREVGQG